MVIAIDGPAGSGKTTIGRMVANALSFALVDTGLFYRAVTVEARRRGIAPDDVPALTSMIAAMVIEVSIASGADVKNLVSINGQDVTAEAQDAAIAGDLARIAQIAEVRRLLIEPQPVRQSGGAVARLVLDFGQRHVLGRPDLRLVQASLDDGGPCGRCRVGDNLAHPQVIVLEHLVAAALLRVVMFRNRPPPHDGLFIPPGRV